MATRDVTTPATARARAPGDAMRARGVVSDETKLSLKTTEFWAMVARSLLSWSRRLCRTRWVMCGLGRWSRLWRSVT